MLFRSVVSPLLYPYIYRSTIHRSVPFPTLYLKQPLSQEPRSPKPAEGTTALFINTARPEDSFQHHMANWYYRMRYWISKTSAKVLITLVVLSIVSFIPALLTDSHDLQITENGDFIIEDLSIDEDGVGSTSSDSTCQDGPSNLHPPDSNSRPGFSI